jgi:outer membrane scaffolding protein for murein synthesis (MipA/OmpV family)
MVYVRARRCVSWIGIAMQVWVCAPALVYAQTPAPLQEWQYSSGIALYKLYEPNTPEWRIETGLAVESRPLYEGAGLYRVLLGPVIDVRYQDLAFASVGEGIGVNVIRGDNYRAGIAVGYDLGRDAKDDLDHLKGLGNVSAAPTVKLFGSYVISKGLPLVLRADVRQFAGGADGAVADFDLYTPLPGSSKKLVLFAGPSVTLADRLHLQTLFGVDSNQARASGYTEYQAHDGLESAGFGFTAIRFIDEHWLVNMNIAANRLLGSAAESPITQARTQKVLVLAAAYRW